MNMSMIRISLVGEDELDLVLFSIFAEFFKQHILQLQKFAWLCAIDASEYSPELSNIPSVLEGTQKFQPGIDIRINGHIVITHIALALDINKILKSIIIHFLHIFISLSSHQGTTNLHLSRHINHQHFIHNLIECCTSVLIFSQLHLGYDVADDGLLG